MNYTPGANEKFQSELPSPPSLLSRPHPLSLLHLDIQKQSCCGFRRAGLDLEFGDVHLKACLAGTELFGIETQAVCNWRLEGGGGFFRLVTTCDLVR